MAEDTPASTSRDTPPTSVGKLTLAERLASTPQREAGGTNMYRGGDYQRYWALAELVRRHESGHDYCLLLEFHDDVAVLDSAAEPTKVWFYQIKTRKASRGHYTARALSSASDAASGEEVPLDVTESSTKLSVMAKLYHHTKHFSPEEVALALVTNARFNLSLASNEWGKCQDLDCISIDQLADDTCETLLEDLREHFGADLARDDLRMIHFIHSPLHLTRARNQAKAELVEYLEREYPDRSLRTQAIFEMLLSDLTASSTDRAPGRTFREIVSAQGITRAAVDRRLRLMTASDEPLPALMRQIDRLQLPWAEEQLLRLRCDEYYRRRANPLHRDIQLRRVALTRLVGDTLATSPQIDLPELVETVVVAARLLTDLTRVRDPELRAAALVEAFVYHAEFEPTAADPSTPEEAA